MDLYEVLGVRPGASAAEIRRAYQRLSRQLHPALNPGDPAAKNRFEAVTSAFEVLSDPQRRGAYDRGETPASPQQPKAPEVRFESFDFSARVRGGAGFRELFGGVLTPAAETARGEDLEQTARIGFEEAFHGTRRQLHLMRQEACPICAGAGDVSHAPTPCASCSGTGSLRASRGGMVFSRRCPDCGGRGAQSRRPCTRCSGEGRLPTSELLQVALPPGVADGARIRVPGAGNAGRRGGPPGDLVLVVEVEPHPFYRREGEDLECTVPISMVEAALGAHVEVPTPDGPVTIEFPAGTQGGQRFRLRKRGLPRLGEKGRGDLWVEAQVIVPAVTEDDARRLLDEFSRLAPQDPRREMRR